MDLRAFWEQDLQFAFLNALENENLGLAKDSSGYVFVDGEEGDYGVIRYLDAAGNVVAIKTIEGGDVESLEVTTHGKPLVAEKLLALFRQTLDAHLSSASVVAS